MPEISPLGVEVVAFDKENVKLNPYQIPKGYILKGPVKAQFDWVKQAFIGVSHPPSLIFMDPPFNIGRNYGEGVNDLLEVNLYKDFLRDCLYWAGSTINYGGAIWMHLPDQWAAHAVVMAEKIGLRLVNWVIWHYRFGQCGSSKFIVSKCHGLWFCVDNQTPKFYPDAVREPSDRATTYGDPRILDTENGGMRVPFDVWGFDKYWGRVTGNSKERVPTQDNQLPEVYLERIIKATTREGDVVFDPFGGSGTTAVVAMALKRTFVTGDIRQQAVDQIIARLEKGAVRV